MQNIKAKFNLSPTVKYGLTALIFMKLAIAAQLFSKYTKFHQSLTNSLVTHIRSWMDGKTVVIST
jgi:hypothetical protein